MFIVFCPFVLFVLAIVLSILLRYTILIAPLVSSNSSYNRYSILLSKLFNTHMCIGNQNKQINEKAFCETDVLMK